MTLKCRIALFHNIFGPDRPGITVAEKAPAAICRKEAETPGGGESEIWGAGEHAQSPILTKTYRRVEDKVSRKDTDFREQDTKKGRYDNCVNNFFTLAF